MSEPSTTPQPPEPMSPWQRASKPAVSAFGMGCFVGIAGAYRTQTSFSATERVLFAGCLGLFVGLACAAATYVVAALYFAAKAEPKGPHEVDANKEQKQNTGRVWAGIIAFVIVLWLVGKALEGEIGQVKEGANRPSEPGTTGTAPERPAKGSQGTISGREPSWTARSEPLTPDQVNDARASAEARGPGFEWVLGHLFL